MRDESKFTVISRSLLLVAVVASFGPTDPASAAMVLQAYAPEKHDRFHDPADPAKAFIGDPYDWSGVGRGTRWATMISPSYFLSATHSHQSAGELFFYTSNDPDGPAEVYTIESGTPIDGSDLWLGKLTTPVSRNINYYPILALPEHADYDDLEIYTFGLSAEGPPTTPTTVRLGRNNFDPGSIESRTVGASTGVTFLYDFDNPGGTGDDESYLQGGDSGGPSFVIHNGDPALVGIHWFIWEDDDDPSLIGSGDTFVPAYVDHINTAMVGEQVTLLPTPEFTWDGLGDGDWHSASRWIADPPNTLPDRYHTVTVHLDTVTVAADAGAYSLQVSDAGQLNVEAGHALQVVSQVGVDTGKLSLHGTLDTRGAAFTAAELEIAPGGLLDVVRDVTIEQTEYVCQLGGPTQGQIIAGGDVILGDGNTLTLEAIDFLGDLSAGQWGNQSRTILTAAGAVAGTFDQIPTDLYLGHGVFYQGVVYDDHSVVVDLLQAAPGDTDGNHKVEGPDIFAIITASLFGDGEVLNPDGTYKAVWGTGDFDGNHKVEGPDIFLLLNASLFGDGIYSNNPAPAPAARAGGDVKLVVTADGLVIDAGDATVTGFVLSSESGILTGNDANNIGLFQEDNDETISGAFAMQIKGEHSLGDVIGETDVDLAGDLTLAYTLVGVPGVFTASVVVPEPGTLLLLLSGFVGLLLWRRRM